MYPIFNDLLAVRLLVRKILENPKSYSWSLQGLGMLRLYLSTELRLHIWDSRYRIPAVSSLHTHPWSFESYVVAGRIRQFRFSEVAATHHHVEHYKTSVLVCSAGNCTRTEPEDAYLFREREEDYGAGHRYRQHADEIHDSMPVDGTVTLVARAFTKADCGRARIFWPALETWVSAEPRVATDAEVLAITSNALERHFPVKES